MTESEKLETFGRMVFGIMTDILVLPHGDQAYARKSVTLPDGHGGTHRLELIVARTQVADAMEEIAAMRFNVTNVNTGGATQ